MRAFSDDTGEFLAAAPLPGNAGSNAAADHVGVLDVAVAQLPHSFRHGHPILDCGHFLPEEQPGATAALLLEFLLARADPAGAGRAAQAPGRTE